MKKLIDKISGRGYLQVLYIVKRFKTSLACLDEGNDDGGYEGDDESRRYAWVSLLPSGRNP